MDTISLSSCEDFEDYCLRTFEIFLQGDLFPYSLRETYNLAYSSWDEAVNDLVKNGVEGFSYQKSPDDDDYYLCMQGFTQHILTHEKSLKLLACFCTTTYKFLVNTFNIPMRYMTECVKGDDGQVKVVHVPINGHQPKIKNPRYSGIMEANGDLVAKVCFDKFLQKSGCTMTTEAIADAFSVPVEGLLCILKQNGVIDFVDEDNNSWTITEKFKDKEYVHQVLGPDGQQELQWTYKGVFFIWLMLTKDYQVKPCWERN